MSDRISQRILLCEDDLHASLVLSYWNLCPESKSSPPLVIRNASRIVPGGNIGWVLDQFPTQLTSARLRQTRAQTLLIVMVDADNSSVEARERDLRARADFSAEDPLVVLIPKRHVETWACAATGQSVAETEDCKQRNLKKSQIRAAARQIHDWARSEPAGDSSCVPSLRVALPRWRRIG